MQIRDLNPREAKESFDHVALGRMDGQKLKQAPKYSTHCSYSASSVQYIQYRIWSVNPDET